MFRLCLIKNWSFGPMCKLCHQMLPLSTFILKVALCPKVFHPKLLSRLNKVIEIMNFVKLSALNTRFARFLFENLWSDQSCLSLLPHGGLLSRQGKYNEASFRTLDELFIFSGKRITNFQKNLRDKFISRLAYLSNILEGLN